MQARLPFWLEPTGCVAAASGRCELLRSLKVCAAIRTLPVVDARQVLQAGGATIDVAKGRAAALLQITKGCCNSRTTMLHGKRRSCCYDDLAMTFGMLQGGAPKAVTTWRSGVHEALLRASRVDGVVAAMVVGILRGRLPVMR